MREHQPLTKDNISHFGHQSWHTNTGNFKGNCPICQKESKKGDLLMLEFDTSDGLSSNEYCSVCGNIRLQEFSDYYYDMRRDI
jgi:hypothetical protein